MLQVESTVHTDEVNELPWSVSPTNGAVVVDATGTAIASFEVRHHLKGVLGNCDKNAALATRAVNAYKKRGGADIRQLQDRITQWADTNFPARTTADILLKLYEEVGEYARNPKAALEMGDIMILLLDVAHKNGIDVHKAVEDKMDINEKRDWTVDPNTRIMRHVELTKA
jgi:NTP pyrophosphatase (non-canonical NTP hydrolase)